MWLVRSLSSSPLRLLTAVIPADSSRPYSTRDTHFRLVCQTTVMESADRQLQVGSVGDRQRRAGIRRRYRLCGVPGDGRGDDGP